MRRRIVGSRFIVMVVAGMLLACICQGATSQTAQNPGVLKVDKVQQALKFSAKTQLTNPSPQCTLQITETGSTLIPIPLECFVDKKGALSASRQISSIQGVTPGTLEIDLEVRSGSGANLHFSGTVKLTQEDIQSEPKNAHPPSFLNISVSDKTLFLRASIDLPDGPHSAQAKLSQGTDNSASPIDLAVSCTAKNNELSAQIPLDSIASRLSPGQLTVDLVFPEELGPSASLHGATKLYENDLSGEMQPVQENPAWYSLSWLTPRARLWALVGAFLLAVGILIFVAFKLLPNTDKPEKQHSNVQYTYSQVESRPDPTKAAPPPENWIPYTTSQSGDAPAAAQGALQVAAAVAPIPPPASKSIEEQLKDAQAKSDLLEGKLARIETSHEYLRGEFEKLTHLSNVLFQSIQYDSNSADAVTRGVQFALAATVNHWIKSPTRNRTDLLALAPQAGIVDAKLATLQDTDQHQKGVSKFRDTEDGAWLWTPIPGTMDFWAAPVDAQFMAMGKAPSQLDEMFEGMENAGHGFQFQEIFRACRLRQMEPNGSYYKLVERGAFKRKDGPAPPGPKAQLFETYAKIVRLGQVDGSLTGRLRDLLEAWVWKTDANLGDFGIKLGEIQQSSTAPVAANTYATREDSRKMQENLEQELKGLKKSFADRLQEVEEGLAALKAVRFAPPIPAPAPAYVPAPAYETRPPLPVAPYIPQAPADRAVPAPPIPFPQAAQSPETRKTPGAGMPPALQQKWHDAYMRAVVNPASKPEITGIPSPELYIERARNLRNSLKAADRSAQVSIMHVKKDPSSSTVEVHPTDENAMGEIVCRVCSEKHTWQLAVVFGAPASNEYYLLFPGGALAKSNFPAGYSALIEDIPSSIFFMQATRPALLGLQDASRSTYVVLQKIALDSSEGEKS